MYSLLPELMGKPACLSVMLYLLGKRQEMAEQGKPAVFEISVRNIAAKRSINRRMVNSVLSHFEEIGFVTMDENVCTFHADKFDTVVAAYASLESEEDREKYCEALDEGDYSVLEELGYVDDHAVSGDVKSTTPNHKLHHPSTEESTKGGAISHYDMVGSGAKMNGSHVEGGAKSTTFNLKLHHHDTVSGAKSNDVPMNGGANYTRGGAKMKIRECGIAGVVQNFIAMQETGATDVWKEYRDVITEKYSKSAFRETFRKAFSEYCNSAEYEELVCAVYGLNDLVETPEDCLAYSSFLAGVLFKAGAHEPPLTPHPKETRKKIYKRKNQERGKKGIKGSKGIVSLPVSTLEGNNVSQEWYKRKRSERSERSFLLHKGGNKSKPIFFAPSDCRDENLPASELDELLEPQPTMPLPAQDPKGEEWNPSAPEQESNPSAEPEGQELETELVAEQELPAEGQEETSAAAMNPSACGEAEETPALPDAGEEQLDEDNSQPDETEAGEEQGEEQEENSQREKRPWNFVPLEIPELTRPWVYNRPSKDKSMFYDIPVEKVKRIVDDMDVAKTRPDYLFIHEFFGLIADAYGPEDTWENHSAGEEGEDTATVTPLDLDGPPEIDWSRIIGITLTRSELDSMVEMTMSQVEDILECGRDELGREVEGLTSQSISREMMSLIVDWDTISINGKSVYTVKYNGFKDVYNERPGKDEHRGETDREYAFRNREPNKFFSAALLSMGYDDEARERLTPMEYAVSEFLYRFFDMADYDFSLTCKEWEDTGKPKKWVAKVEWRQFINEVLREEGIETQDFLAVMIGPKFDDRENLNLDDWLPMFSAEAIRRYNAKFGEESVADEWAEKMREQARVNEIEAGKPENRVRFLMRTYGVDEWREWWKVEEDGPWPDDELVREADAEVRAEEEAAKAGKKPKAKETGQNSQPPEKAEPEEMPAPEPEKPKERRSEENRQRRKG